MYDALANKYPGLVSAGDGAYVFQFSQGPQGASWITGTDANAYGIANAVPVDLGGFYVPGDSLDNSYSTLIKSIKPKDGQDNPAYKKKLIQVSDLSSQEITLRDAATKDYYSWAANNTKSDGTPAKSFDEWLTYAFGGSSWGVKMNELASQIDELNSEMSAILKTMDAGLSDALSNLGTDTMPISRGGKAIQVPAVTILGDLASDKSRWDGYGTDEFDFDITINKDAVIKYPWKTVYETTVKHDCFETSVETHVNTSRIIADVNYNLRFTAKGLQGYQVSRGKWYYPAYVNPNVQLVDGIVGLTNDSFFGVNGSLHLIPETILVMYRPTIKLTVSEQTYKQQFAANADAGLDWVDFFSFRFKFDTIASLQPVDNGDGTTTITFSSPENASPQIIGVTSKVVYNEN
ncbi:hypothetical protein GCM10025859_08250 [Alicyclobacillus fastidiosus]|nr:hypothetical protein GCM10025859_08250 [Alicyclobacillus fastidiosus]